jgi:hypothetical protein
MEDIYAMCIIYKSQSIETECKQYDLSLKALN